MSNDDWLKPKPKATVWPASNAMIQAQNGAAMMLGLEQQMIADGFKLIGGEWVKEVKGTWPVTPQALDVFAKPATPAPGTIWIDDKPPAPTPDVWAVTEIRIVPGIKWDKHPDQTSPMTVGSESFFDPFPKFFYHAETDDAIRCDDQSELDSLMKTGEDLQPMTAQEYADWLAASNYEQPAIPVRDIVQAPFDLPYSRGENAKLQGDGGWLEPKTGDLPHAFTKAPIVQANPLDTWPSDVGEGSRYFIGYQNAALYVVLSGPYDTIEETQDDTRCNTVWERFVNDPALMMSFPTKDRALLTTLVYDFKKSLRKGSYGRL